MREILGEAKTVRQLMTGTKFSIDYYQREYRWEAKQVSELIEDLASRFLEDYDENHERAAVQDYGHYFLGSIILSRKDGHDFIIDGQQRLTTLTLLLIHLNHLQARRDDQVSISELIYSEKFGKKSFNIDVAERAQCMNALFEDEPFDPDGESESVHNLMGRYATIIDRFPEELSGDALPYFIDWLIESVHLVEITAYSDDDAYAIFETMNDRGLSLTSSEMLKGYLLANIAGDDAKARVNEAWKREVGAFVGIDKEGDADFIKAWLRAQHAGSIRERKRGAIPLDFDRIGTEFHRWVRDKREVIGLESSADFERFVESEMSFFARRYGELWKAEGVLVPGLEPVLYNAQLGFGLQHPVLLAPLSVGDTEDMFLRKLGVVGTFIDILLARRIWNFRSIAHSTMQYAMFTVMRDIRHKELDELVDLLEKRLAADEETFSTENRLRLHRQNRYQVHKILARITAHLETQSEMPNHYINYIGGTGQARYEIEHIWSDHPENHVDEFPHPEDFREYRDRIGGLLLVPRSFNESYGDMSYGEKLQHYDSQNLLARSLGDPAYDHNPGFRKYIEKTGLPFRSHPSFKRADIDSRQDLYRLIAEEIWSPGRLAEMASG